MRSSRFLLSFVVATLCFATPALARDKVFEASYPLASGGSFELMNVNGSVEVEGWDRDEVHVRAVTRSKTNPDDEARVKIDVQAAPGSVVVRTLYPREDGLDVSVEYKVRVPARILNASIETVNGNVRARRVEGSGRLRTVNGDVVLLDGAGQMSARTTNGNIRAELAHLGEGQRPVVLETVNGSVLLEVPASTDADLAALSLNGDFQSEIPLAIQSRAGRRELFARMGRGGHPLAIRTVNGGIRIVIMRTSV
jgi:hypothetical protein